MNEQEKATNETEGRTRWIKPTGSTKWHHLYAWSKGDTYASIYCGRALTLGRRSQRAAEPPLADRCSHCEGERRRVEKATYAQQEAKG